MADAPFITILIGGYAVAASVVGGLLAWKGWMGRTESKQSVASTVTENIIAQVENLREITDCLRKEMQNDRVERARLEERVIYIQKQLSDIASKLDPHGSFNR